MRFQAESILPKTAAPFEANSGAVCVPVGLTKCRDKLPKLTPFDKESSLEVIKIVDEFRAECMEKYGLEEVCVVPQPKAGGSFATTAWEHFSHPVAVEHIRAKAGLDIGGTLIGMHMKEVAVPVRLSLRQIGEAPILCARTRPKFIGGERAYYCDELK